MSSLEHAKLTGATLLGYSLHGGETEALPALSSLAQSDYRSVLLHDSVLLFASALSSLSNSLDPVMERLTCSDTDSVSTQGEEMLRHLHSARLEGLTGEISFTDGERHNIQIQLVKRGEDGLKNIGSFKTKQRHLELDSEMMEELEIGEKFVIVKVVVAVNLMDSYGHLNNLMSDILNTFKMEIELKFRNSTSGLKKQLQVNV